MKIPKSVVQATELIVDEAITTRPGSIKQQDKKEAYMGLIYKKLP